MRIGDWSSDVCSSDLLTERGGSPVITLVSTGNPLPAPVELTATFPDPAGDFDQLERLEGMRVTAASLTVNAPTLGSVSETNATATSNGVFHAVVTGVARAYREPGVQQPDPPPARRSEGLRVGQGSVSTVRSRW